MLMKINDEHRAKIHEVADFGIDVVNFFAALAKEIESFNAAIAHRSRCRRVLMWKKVTIGLTWAEQKRLDELR
jgi:hypothetical protein